MGVPTRRRFFFGRGKSAGAPPYRPGRMGFIYRCRSSRRETGCGAPFSRGRWSGLIDNPSSHARAQSVRPAAARQPGDTFQAGPSSGPRSSCALVCFIAREEYLDGTRSHNAGSMPSSRTAACCASSQYGCRNNWRRGYLWEDRPRHAPSAISRLASIARRRRRGHAADPLQLMGLARPGKTADGGQAWLRFAIQYETLLIGRTFPPPRDAERPQVKTR